MSRKLFSLLLIALLTALLAACAPPPAPVAPAASGGEAAAPLAVFGAYATAIEEPWDGVIHAALNQAQADGKIAYT